MSDPWRQPPDTLELSEVVRALWRGKAWILAGVLLGAVVAVGVNTFGPVRYEATASVVLRDRTESGSGGLGLGGGAGGALEGMADFFSLPGRLGSLVDTEVEILQSRMLLNQISDSVGLQIRVPSHRHVGPDSLFSSYRVDPDVPEREYAFRLEDGSYRVVGEDVRTSIDPADRLELPGVVLTLRPRGVPGEFRIRILPRQEVVDRILEEELYQAEIIGGDLAEVAFSAPDPLTASHVVNTAVEVYLDERKSRIREVTGNRLDILTRLADSLRGELFRATTEYREYQEAQRAFDPNRLGDVERAAELRARVDALEVEARSLDEVLNRMATDSVPATDILAYPSFLGSEAVNSILEQIFTLQSRRFTLLERRTPQDPEVVLIERNIEYLKEELEAMGRSYRDGIQRQLEQLAEELQEYRDELANRPLQEERTLELENEIERLTTSYVGLQGQLVQVRLASIGEGMDLRQIDSALPPREPEFPVWWLNLAIGLVAGLFLGIIAALIRSALSTKVRDAGEVRRNTGLPVVTPHGPGASLFLRSSGSDRAVILLPLSGAEEMAAEGVMDEALVLRGVDDPRLSEADPAETIVIPVVRKGETTRNEVEEALQALAILEMRVPGVLLLSD